jgi:predicted permease
VLPLAAVCQCSVNMLIAKLISSFMYASNPTSEKAKELTACVTFTNNGPLPMVFATGILSAGPNPKLVEKAIAYISLYLLGYSPFFWTLGPKILAKEVETAAPEETKLEKTKKLLASILSPPVTASIIGMIVGFVPLLRDTIMRPDGLFTPLIDAMRTMGQAYLPCVLLILSGSLLSAGSSKPKEKEDSLLPSVESSLLQQPTEAPSSRSARYVPGNVDDGTNITGVARVASEPTKTRTATNDSSNLAFARQVLAIYLAKFLIMPTIVFTLLGFLRSNVPTVARAFVQDPMLLFILLLETCMPSAQNLTMILQLQGQQEFASRIAKTLLFVYVLGVPAICYWIVKIIGFTTLF